MKKRWMAMLLAAAVVFAPLVPTVLAEDDVNAPVSEETAVETAAEETAQEADETQSAPQTEPPAESAQSEPIATAEASETQQSAPETVEPLTPDPAGTVSFANLESRVRENNYTILALEQRIETIDKTDLDKLRRDLVDGINQISEAQWGIISAYSAMGATNPLMPMMGSMQANSLQSTYDTMRRQLEDIKAGKTARDLESARRRLDALEWQVIAGAENLYIAICGMDDSDAALTRSLAAVDRGIRAAEVSRDGGLVSELSVQQAKNGRVQLASGQKTLRGTQENCRLQLEAMIGAELGAPMKLAALPKVTDEQLAAMQVEDDLARAKEASADLFEANGAVLDARRTYDDDKTDDNRRAMKAEEYTYAAAVQNFELSFRALAVQVEDCAQKRDAAKSALALEEKNYAVSALKRRQGTISENALADAKDTLADAKDTLAGAERDLLTAYRTYVLAAEHGILN